MTLKIILCALFGYLVGCINPSYIIGRIRGMDIRKKGSGNAGASNAMILMGKAVGIFSAVFDIFKAATVMWLAPVMFPGAPLAAEIAGSCCVIGHIFPAYMKFRGGKGLACLGGIALAMDWRFFLILLAAEVGLALWVDYICVMPITASFIIPLSYGLLGSDGMNLLHSASNGWWGAAVIGVGCIGILSRHGQNLRRIRAGTELHLSYLWRRDKETEIARITGADQNPKNSHKEN